MSNILHKSSLLCLFILVFTTGVRANGSILQSRYTKGHPVLYEDVWDMAPYSYLNDHGQPEGFNIDLVRMICKRLNIPVVFKLRPFGESLEALQSESCDLTIAVYFNQRKRYGLFGDNTITIFTYSTLGPKGWANRIKTRDDLLNNKVIVRRKSFCDYLMRQKGLLGNSIPYDDMAQAAMHIEDKDSGQILYNTMAIKWLKRQYKLDNLVITPVDMEHAEYRFMSHDATLLHAVDSVFTVMSTENDLQPLRNKWFYPEHTQSVLTKGLWKMIIGSSAFVICILLLYQFIYRLRLKHIQERIRRENKRLVLIQEAGNVRMWTYNVHEDTFTTYHSNGDIAHQYSSQKFYLQYSTEDSSQIRKAIFDIKEGITSDASLAVQRFVRKDPHNKHIFYLKISVMHRTKGRAISIIGTNRDFTNEQHEQEEANKLMLRYTSLFNGSTLAMISYDANGIIKDMNATAMKIFGIKDKQAFIRSRRSIKDNKNIRNLDFDKQSVYFFSTINDHDYEKWASLLVKVRDKFYYENIITAVKDEQEKIIAYYSIGRDITDLVKESHREKEEMNKVLEASSTLKKYISQINNALYEGRIRFIDYNPFNHSITITRENEANTIKLSQAQFLNMAPKNEWKRIIMLMKQMDEQKAVDFDATFQLTRTFDKEETRYWQVICSPSLTSEGGVRNYKLLCRDVTKLTLTNMRLKEENKKAQETELLKRAFLQNMSYEIRIPLNAVIGFAELFDTEHDLDDERVFAAEIKKNTETLLELVNDVLLLSKLDANMIEIKKEPIDFASIFETLCEQGWHRDLSEDVKAVIVNPFEHLVADIDLQYLSYVIQHVARNAAHFTSAGFIQDKYEKRQDSLTILIEDTGSGISPEDLPHIFDRFMRSDNNSHQFGTGLGLSISKAIIELMGGQIEVRSELGRGTWVWILLPCKVESIVRKQELSSL